MRDGCSRGRLNVELSNLRGFFKIRHPSAHFRVDSDRQNTLPLCMIRQGKFVDACARIVLAVALGGCP